MIGLRLGSVVIESLHTVSAYTIREIAMAEQSTTNNQSGQREGGWRQLLAAGLAGQVQRFPGRVPDQPCHEPGAVGVFRADQVTAAEGPP